MKNGKLKIAPSPLIADLIRNLLRLSRCVDRSLECPFGAEIEQN